MTRDAFTPPTHDEARETLARLSLSLSEARTRYAAGLPVTMLAAPYGAEALSWSYATVRADNGRPMVRLPGVGRWGPIDLYGWRESTDGVHSRAARGAVDILSPDGGTPAAHVMFLPERACNACGKPLTTPLSYAAGLGPDCGGRYAEMRARSEAKRARIRGLTFNANPHAMPAATLNLAPAAGTVSEARCAGTCDPRKHCNDCDGPK